MKVINKLESYPTGDMIVPYCPNCDNPTYSERKCPFCNTELEYEEIIEKDKEIERLNNIINELEKCIKDKYYEAIDYQTKIRQSDLMQGDYPASYYLSEQNEQLCNYFLSRLKDLQELKGSE